MGEGKMNKPKTVLGALLVLIMLMGIFLTAPALAQDAKSIVSKSDSLMRGAKSYGRMKMIIERPKWTRTIVMDVWTKGTANAFIRTLSPAKEKGVTFLKIGREAWNYLPSVERTIKIPPSMMLQSWMGSDFTNDDLVKADSLIVDYTHKIIGEFEGGGQKQWKLELIPKENAAVVWGKVVMNIRKDNYVMTKTEYYNEDMVMVKFIETGSIQKIEGKDIPMKLSMTNLRKTGHKTSMIYEKLTFKPNISADTFTQGNLKSKGGM